jgi:hypothetical protein
MKKLLFFWNELKSSFWFVPILIVISSILLSIGLVYLDVEIDSYKVGLKKYFWLTVLIQHVAYCPLFRVR